MLPAFGLVKPLLELSAIVPEHWKQQQLSNTNEFAPVLHLYCKLQTIGFFLLSVAWNSCEVCTSLKLNDIQKNGQRTPQLANTAKEEHFCNKIPLNKTNATTSCKHNKQIKRARTPSGICIQSQQIKCGRLNRGCRSQTWNTTPGRSARENAWNQTAKRSKVKKKLRLMRYWAPQNGKWSS